MPTDLETILQTLEARMHRAVIRALDEERELPEHREEIESLLASSRLGAQQDALALALFANRRPSTQ